MVGGTAGDDEDAIDGRKVLLAHAQLVEKDTLLAQTALEQALDGLGLLGDLLLHEVGVAAERCRGGVPVDVEGARVLDGGALGVVDGHLAGLLEEGDLAVLELDHVGGHACEGCDVRGGIGAVGRGGNHERRAVAGNHELAGGVGAHDGERPGALEAAHGVAHGRDQVALAGTVPGVLHEVRHDLGVGVGGKGVAIAGQVAAELAVVLDDAVVDDGDAAGAVQVRVGVLVGGGAVRGPARVGDARGACEVCGLAAVGEDRDATRALHAVELAVRREHLDASRVVAAVLERCQTVKQELGRLLLAGVSNDSAHVCPLACRLRYDHAFAPVRRTLHRVYQPRAAPPRPNWYRRRETTPPRRRDGVGG